MAGRTTAAALDVRDLCVDLGGRPVLREVSLAVRRGELAGLLGPNGAGKTTLLRAVLGLVPRHSGQVLADGQPAQARRIGYVPQRHEFAWDMPLTVRDAVMSALTGRIGLLRRARMEHHRAVESALVRTAMADLSDRPVGELSGGQRQRVLVARALALDPQVLLLDEPMTGLDMPTQDVLHDLFRSLADEGRALLMTTHDLVTAVALMDRIHLVNRRVVASGRPEDLRDAQPWTEAFAVGADNPLLAALRLRPPAPAQERQPHVVSRAGAAGQAASAAEAGGADPAASPSQPGACPSQPAAVADEEEMQLC